MIKDTIKNIETYKNLNDRLYSALEYLRDNDFTKIEPGTYTIDGDDIYAMVKEYDTAWPDYNCWEAHENYIDVQYMVSGEEHFGVVNVDELQPVQAYDEANDCSMYFGDKPSEFVTLKKDDLIVVWPQDAHMPQRAKEKISAVKKVVIKVRI